METTNRPSRPDRIESLWNDWGDPDDPMETRLLSLTFFGGNLPTKHEF